jgi:hypothetical protein
MIAVSFMDEIAGFLPLLLQQLSQVFLKMISWIQSLPYSLIQPIHIDLLQAILLFQGVCALFLALRKRKAIPFIVGCLCLSGIFAIDLHRNIRCRGKQKIIVYHVPGISCIELVCGPEGIMIIGESSEFLESKVDYHTRNHIQKERRTTRKCDLHDLSGFVPSRNLDGLTLLIWNGKSIGILHDNFNLDRLRSITLDYLIISLNAYETSENATEDLSIRQVVWDSSCRDDLYNTMRPDDWEDRPGNKAGSPTTDLPTRMGPFRIKENNDPGHHVSVEGPFIDHLN